MDEAQVTVAVEQVRLLAYRRLRRLRYPPRVAALITDILLYAQIGGNSQGVLKLLRSGTGSLADAPGDEADDQQEPRTAAAYRDELTALPCGLFEAPRQLPQSRKARLTECNPWTLHIDGRGENAMVVMGLATAGVLSRARAHGIGLAGTCGTNTSTGAVGYYARWIAQCGCIGLVCSGSSPHVAPASCAEALLGTNPLAWAAPLADGATEPLVFDMSTSAITYWEVGAAAAAQQPLPPGVAIDRHGRATRDPAAVEALLTVAGWKGTGLSLLVEVLTGPLVGAACASAGDSEGVQRNWGNVVVALDPGAFGAGLGSDGDHRRHVIAGITALVQRIRSARPDDQHERPAMVGDRSAARRRDAQRTGAMHMPRWLLHELQEAVDRDDDGGRGERE